MKKAVRKKRKFETGQQALLDAIWRHKGGVATVSKILKVSIQTPMNWKNRGKVPLVLCGEVAKKLGVGVWALNYEEYCKFNVGETVPSWDIVVRSFPFAKSTIDSILALKPPEVKRY